MGGWFSALPGYGWVGIGTAYWGVDPRRLTPFEGAHTIASTMLPLSRSPVLRGCKLILREKKVTDAPMDFVWASDAELMRLDAAECIPLSYSVFLSKYIESLRDPTKRHFAIETLDGRHIGNCVCYNFHDLHREAELGIVIGDRAYWGRGYGGDAVVTLARYMFDVLQIERICLHTLAWNVRAQKCFQK